MSQRQIEIPEPPDHLSERSKQLWRDLVPKRAKSPGRLALLQTALEALDRADEARELISTEGLTTVTETTGAVHLNPLVKLERESRQAFMKAWGLLHFDFDIEIDGDWQHRC